MTTHPNTCPMREGLYRVVAAHRVEHMGAL